MSDMKLRKAAAHDETFWRIKVQIFPSKLEEFRTLVREQITSALQEPGTLDYDWYFNADNSACHTYERYRDSEAVIRHATTFVNTFAERFLQTCRPTDLDVYGMPNEAAKALLDPFNPTYYSTREGFAR
jgi:quinol monooxygenase YgiN